MHLVLFDWDKVGTDDFLGEALLALDEYLDGARQSNPNPNPNPNLALTLTLTLTLTRRAALAQARARPAERQPHPARLARHGLRRDRAVGGGERKGRAQALAQSENGLIFRFVTSRTYLSYSGCCLLDQT